MSVINQPGQSSGQQSQASSTFPPSTSSGHHQQLSSLMANQFFQPQIAEQSSNVWNNTDQSNRDWINQAIGSRGNFSSSLPSFSQNIYDKRKESDSESISDDERSFFSDCSDSEDEDGEDEFKVRLRRLNRWMDNDLSPIQQVVTILSLINRSKKLDAVSKSFIRSHINIFNRQDESVSSDEDQSSNIDPMISNGEKVERRRKARFRKQQEEEREFDRKVQDANSLNFWQLYFNARGNVPRNDELLDLLLQYLPLVHVDVHGKATGDCSPDVTPLNILYLHLISSVLSKVVSLKLQPASSELLSKCRSLMSIALISRCFTKEQKASLNSLFMTKLLLQSHASKQLQEQGVPGLDPRTSLLRFTAESVKRLQGEEPQFDCFSPTFPIFSSQQEQPSIFSPPPSLPSGLNGQGNRQSQGPGTRHADREPFSGEGMSGVPQFLKTLRLHKYTDCFALLPSLNAFMNLSESDLESLGVAAKGARKKFCQHLEKLRSRPETLSQLLLSSNASIEGDILPGIQSALSAGPLCKESKTEINLIVHLLLKVKSVELNPEQNLKLIETIDKCLQFPVSLQLLQNFILYSFSFFSRFGAEKNQEC